MDERQEGADRPSFSETIAQNDGGEKSTPPPPPPPAHDRPSLHVLVVEKDETTLRAVAEQLRKCGYEVTEAADGLEAWRVLTNPNNHIDLVLSEIDISGLSGVALLSKIIEHDTLKRTPVVMMSSHGSTGVVFNCLTKGAVDFLMKPLRRNELKNLWQHVWRRYQSPYGSWSKKSVESKGNQESDDINTYSSEESDSLGVALKGRCAHGNYNQDSGSVLRCFGLSSLSGSNSTSNSNESRCENMEIDFPCVKSSEIANNSLIGLLSPSNTRSPNLLAVGVADSFSYMDNRGFEDLNGPFKTLEISTEAVSDAKKPISTDFTSKRLEEVDEHRSTAQDE